ncbi:MAG: hypothetical protein VYE68_09380 [Acidobacteriota bacterium]|nr:hypothetical protein [Acidobacteriota bacterium]
MIDSRCRRLTVVVLAAALVVLVDGTARAQEPPTEEQEREVLSLVTVVRAALEGRIVATGEPFQWDNDFLKSSQGVTFVPFTLQVPQAKLTTASAAMYLYIVSQQTQVGETADVPAAAFEDGYIVDLGAPNENGFYEIRRGFSVPSGEYDVYVALRESAVLEGAEPTTMMLKKALSVPNLWSDQLVTSSIILADRIESLAAPPPADQLLANPYTLGNLRIIPKTAPEFPTSGEFSLVFLVYNAGVTETGMPDVNVEYTFNTKTVDSEEFFNRTNPQAFNERTLPQGFDLDAGHQLVAGQAVPLSSFPVADYRLEIVVTDNISGASLTRSVDFSVTEF